MRPSATPTGLTAAEVVASRAAHGANVLTPPPRESPLRQLAAKFADPLIVILLAAGALSLGVAAYEFAALGEGAAAFFEPVGIFVAVLLATGLSFLFERRAGRAFDLLNQVNDDEPVLAVRDGETVRIPKRDVVVGDIVSLATGDEIPADGELLDAVSLGVDESTLTGEPLCRKTTDPRAFDRDATFPSNHVLRGTKVMEGHGAMRVTAVGDGTENGRVFAAARIDDSVKTPLDEQLAGLLDADCRSLPFAFGVQYLHNAPFIDEKALVKLFLPAQIHCFQKAVVAIRKMSQHGRQKHFPVHIDSQFQCQRTGCLFYLFRKFLLIDVDSRPDHKEKAAGCRLIHFRQNSADFFSVYYHVIRPFDLRIQMKLPYALRYGDRHQQRNHRHMRRFRLRAQ